MNLKQDNRIVKFPRRQLGFALLGIGVTGRLILEYLRVRGVNKQAGLTDRDLAEDINIVDAAYASEVNWEKEIAKRKTILASDNITPPTQPYNREISKRLIQFCKLGVQQYKTARSNSNYDGNIEVLPAYSEDLKGYTQLTNFTIEEEIIENLFPDRNAPIPSSTVNNITRVDETIQEVEFRLQDRVRTILSKRNRIRVYSGILLASNENNVLVFRGTQTQAEWLKNLNANQKQYINPTGEVRGAVHEGFFQLTNDLSPAISDAVQQLDPTIPFYITGHSLGAAVATLAALEIAQKVPQLKDQIQLYTYAGPRVCSPTLAKFHSQLIPNSYRIVNLGDTVPLVPPVTIGKSYVHIGQEWSFLAQFGDVLLNHVVDTYIAAMEQEAESEGSSLSIKQLQLG
ncbi:MAG: lipase family protein [Pleurocapsa sp. MO_226.B13]|nr:lipase family protein [Pleurocapsa sp. MO_226.B13]